MVRDDTLPPPLAIYIPQSNESQKIVVLHIVLRIKLYDLPYGRNCSNRVKMGESGGRSSAAWAGTSA